MPGTTRGSIGVRIAEWLGNLPVARQLRDYQGDVVARLNEIGSGWWEQTFRLFRAGQIGQALLVHYTAVLYVLFGRSIFRPQDILKHAGPVGDEAEKFVANPQGYLRDKLHEFGSSAEARAFAEFVGTVVTEPVVSLLEQYAGEENPDVHAMARAFHGIASGLPWASGTLDSILATLLGPRAPRVGKAIDSLYWGLGLGFLGWQTLAPLLSAGLQPNLERYYNRRFTPARFNASQLRDLLALGMIDANELAERLAEQGWRPGDIQTWIALSYRVISEGVAWDLYENGTVSQDWMTSLLRAHGYNPQDIPLLIKAHEKQDVKDAGKFLASTAKKSFREGLIDEAEFRQILSNLNYAPREIDLQVELLRGEQQAELRDLSTGQVRQLYVGGLLGRDEAKAALLELNYSQSVADNLLTLWYNQSLPKTVRINKSTVVAAYRNGVLSRDEAAQKLVAEVGHTPQNAELILRIEDAKSARQESPVVPTVAPLSLSTLRELVEAGLISRSDFENRAELDRFSEADRALLTDLFFRLTDVNERTASDELLFAAYLHGLLTRDELAARLVGAGAGPEDVELAIRTFELENPVVFGEYQPQYLKQPSVSQMQLALQRGLITEQQFRDKLAAWGYSLDAVEVYLQNASYVPPSEPRKLTSAQVLRLYRELFFSRAEAVDRLVELGYTIEDANLLVTAEGGGIADTEVADSYLAGYLDRQATAVAFSNLGFSIDEIENFFERYE